MANLQDVLSKKLISGLATKNPGLSFTVESLSSRSAIFKNQIYGQDIPSTAPTDLTTSTVIPAPEDNKDKSVTGLQQESNNNKHIQKFTKLPLYDPIGSGKSFLYSTNQAINYLSQTIPYSFDPAGGYQYTVYGKNGSPMNPSDTTYPWVLDTDAGVLVFTGAGLPENDPRYPPNITFWRYNGTLGVGTTSGESILNLNNVFTGINTVPTAAVGTNTTQIASTAFVLANTSSIKPKSNGAIAIGENAGQTNQGTNSIAIGNAAGQTNQGTSAIAIGNAAGQTNQGTSAIAIGLNAGQVSQQLNAVAIGNAAGQTNQGTSAIAIGNAAGQT
ncbi:MAG: hypothetical protein EB000_01555, partial [Alphaproteobacteria bacterium]|nr:hypothetical protein [Alphaproteobacteria bacterium]